MDTNLDACEGDLFSILCDDERPGRMVVVQYGSELDDLQIFVANVGDSGSDPQFGHGRDIVGGSREGNLKTSGGANHGVGVSTDDCKIESYERQGAWWCEGARNWGLSVFNPDAWRDRGRVKHP